MVFHCLDVAKLIYPVTYWRTSWLPPSLGNYEQSCYKHLCAASCIDLDHKVRVCLLYKKLPSGLPKWWHRVALPLSVNESSCCSTSSSAFGVVSVLDSGHSNRFIELSHCCFKALIYMSLMTCQVSIFSLTWSIFSYAYSPSAYLLRYFYFLIYNKGLIILLIFKYIE